MVTNAWKNVVNECNLEDVTTAQLFNKRWKEGKGLSGSGLADVIDAKDRLKALHFLSWRTSSFSARNEVKVPRVHGSRIS